MRFYAYEGTLKKKIKLESYEDRRSFCVEVSICTE